MAHGVKGKAIIIAIDGHAGSGKTTAATLLADHLQYKHLNTGAMYRGLTAYFLDHQINWHHEETRKRCLEGLNVKMQPHVSGYRMLFNGIEFDPRRLYEGDVADKVNAVSACADVRVFLHRIQRPLGEPNKGIVAEGRDIATDVFPQAELKIFMTASLEERAKRRYHELKNQRLSVQLAEVKQELQKRDQRDQKRAYGALRKIKGMRELDTTALTKETQLQCLLEWANQAINSA